MYIIPNKRLRRLVNFLFQTHKRCQCQFIHSWFETEKAMDRDNFMNAEESKTFGLIDTVMQKKSSGITTNDSPLK